MTDVVSQQSLRSLPARTLYVQYQDVILVVFKSGDSNMCLRAPWNPISGQEVSKVMLNRTLSSAVLSCCDGLPVPTPRPVLAAVIEDEIVLPLR